MTEPYNEALRCQWGAVTSSPCESLADFYCDDGHEMGQMVWCKEHKINCRGHEHPPIYRPLEVEA